MRRVLIATVGSHGDVHPYLAVARALVQRGHEVRFAVHPHFHRAAELAGVEAVPLDAGLDYLAIVGDPRLTRPWRAPSYIVNGLLERAPGMARETIAHAKRMGVDAIFAHHICFGTRWLAEAEGLPCAIGALAPSVWFNPSDPAPTVQRYVGSNHAKLAKLLNPAARGAARLLANRRLRWVQADLGAGGPPADIIREFRKGAPMLGMWSPTFRGAVRGDPERSRICGFPWHDRAEHEAEQCTPATQAFLDAGEPPLVFTAGTSAVFTAERYFARAIDAVRRSGRRAIVLRGRGLALPDNLPKAIHATEYEPFSSLLPRAACVVHHGGIGTTAQALRAGVPNIVLPMSNDQFNNAIRVVNLGAGLTCHATRATPRRLGALIERTLADEQIAACAERTGAAIRNEPDGAVVAAEVIESL